MMAACNPPRHLLGALLLLASATPATAGRIWLKPSAQVPDHKALAVTVEGLERGQKATVTIQEDCGSGEPRQNAHCPALWGPEQTPPQDNKPGLLFTIAPEKLALLPRDRVLWVVVEAAGWPRPAISRFHRADPCTTLATILNTFITGGRCTLGLRQVLRDLTRGADTLDGKTFEVQLLHVATTGAKPESMADTRDATGVAWASASEILITSAVGLSKLDLVHHTASVLVRLGEGERPLAAPLALPNAAEAAGRRRVAFVRQSAGPQRLGDPEAVAELEIWPDGQRFALPYKVHQLLAADRKGSRFVALSLGLDDATPLLFAIDLEHSTIDPLGFDPRLYQAFLKSPRSDQAAVAFEEARSGNWRIGLAEGDIYQRDLVTFPDRSALAPAWSPDGSQIAFLVEALPEPQGPKPRHQQPPR